MINDPDNGIWNKAQIENHLKSAVDSLTPDVLGRIDLKQLQEPPQAVSKLSFLNRRIRVLGGVAAACICLMAVGGGTSIYRNSRVDSLIGIDVNPSIELSVNRKNHVLTANALNEDAVAILDGMELKGVDLDVAVNAVIGSMVKHGYLDDLDNAILVTVANDSVSKAAELRETVVGGIEESLVENQVHAVVYDQQAVTTDNVTRLAEEYDISYGKAYFLQELINQNPSLTMADMKEFAPLTMEEIAKEITERSYALGERTEKSEDKSVTGTMPETSLAAVTIPETTTLAPATEAPAETSTEAATTAAPTQAPTTEPETEAVLPKVKIDNADYYDGVLTIHFESKVKWKNPSVSVKDEDGVSYASVMGDTSSSSCNVFIEGLEGGRIYTYTIHGVYLPGGSKGRAVKGTFEAPYTAEEETAAEVTPKPPQETDAPSSEPALPLESGESQPETAEPESSGAESAPPETQSKESQSDAS